MAMLTAIYGLYDPQTYALRYIGKSRKPHERWLQHCRPKSWPSHKDQPISKWCSELREQRLKPVIRILTWCADWETAERRLIAAYRKAGADLLNVSDGGWPNVVRQNKAQAAASVAKRSPQWQSAAITLGRQAWEAEEPAKTLIKQALHNIKTVRRKMQREGSASDLERFDANAHSHIVLNAVRDFPVLPWHPTYDRCWNSPA